MTRAFVLLGCLMASSGGLLAAQVPADSGTLREFEVSSIGADYPFVVSLKGVYRVFPDRVVIDVSEGMVVSQVPARFGTRGRATQVTLAAALGSGTVDSWSALADTPPVKVGSELPAEGRLVVHPMRFTIQVTDSIPLADRWIAFQLGVHQHLPLEGFPDGLLYSFACTEDYLLGPTPESRVRAQAQRKRYATVC